MVVIPTVLAGPRYSLHCFHPGTTNSQPVLYALLTSKSAAIYKVLLKTIKEACLNTLYQHFAAALRLKVITLNFQSGFILLSMKHTERLLSSLCVTFISLKCINRHIQSHYKEFQFMALVFLPLEEVELKTKQMIAELPESPMGIGVYFHKTWINGMSILLQKWISLQLILTLLKGQL